MEVYLLRHGEAESGPDVPDQDRALSEEGRRQVKRAAGALARMEPKPPAILSSPLSRALQTAELAAAEYKPSPAIRPTEALIPPGDFGRLMDEIKETGAERVLLVGHEPLLGRFMWAMIAGASPGAIPMRKASMARVDLPTPVLGDGKLVWVMPPEVVRELGSGRSSEEESM